MYVIPAQRCLGSSDSKCEHHLDALTAHTNNVFQQEISMSEAEIEKEIQAKGLNAPRLTPALIDAAIAQEQYHVFEGSQLTVCCLTLQNGFTVVGESACASPANFNAELGQKIAAREGPRQDLGARRLPAAEPPAQRSGTGSIMNVAPRQRLLPPGKPEQLTDAVLRDHRHEAVSASGTCASHGYHSAPEPHGSTVDESR
jgi:Phage protein (N4 Gp49/phage Sf6 gene 66) family